MSKQMPKVNGLPQFIGPFKELLPDYIYYKRAQGYVFRDPNIYKLREMDMFFLENGVKKVEFTRQMYEAWTNVRPGEKESNVEHRRSAARGFACYLVSLGYENIYTGYDDTRIFKRDFIPYVFSKEEIRRMFCVISKWCVQEPGLRNDSFRIAMLLYYCCGFRKSEVLGLKMANIDLDTGRVTILNGKNNVSRIVVASDSLRFELKDYHRKYRTEAAPEEYFLTGEKTEHYPEGSLYGKFRTLLSEAGIALRADGGRQRIHDIRHTFCVHTLEKMQEKGFDLYTSLPLLSVYLGHKHITETEYYLRMMEEHFSGILEKSAAYSPNLFPKYDGEDGGTGAE